MQKITKLEGMPTCSPEDTENFMVEKRTYEGEEMDVIFRKGHPGKTLKEVEELRASGQQVPDFSICAEYTPRTYTATKVAPHIICDQDVPCVLRDGTIIYSDIYRPANAPEQLPVIVCWGPRPCARPRWPARRTGRGFPESRRIRRCADCSRGRGTG